MISLDWYASENKNANPAAFQYLLGRVEQQTIKLKRVAWQWGGANETGEHASQWLYLRVKLPFLSGRQLQSNVNDNTGTLTFPNKRFEMDQIHELDWQFEMCGHIEQGFTATLEGFSLRTDALHTIDMTVPNHGGALGIHDNSLMYFGMTFEFNFIDAVPDSLSPATDSQEQNVEPVMQLVDGESHVCQE
jgi:hypothetical protein